LRSTPASGRTGFRCARFFVVVFACAAGALSCGVSEPPATPPNVLVYVLDTLRADHLGAYGNPLVETPHFDRVAAEGVTFERVYAPTSWTRPAMATLFTGVEPGAHRIETRNDVLPDAVLTLPEILKQHGYATAYLTANPNAGSLFGFAQGVDEMGEMYAQQNKDYIDPRERMAKSDAVTDRALAWLDTVGEQPFALIVLSIDPHFPYSAPEERVEREKAKTPLDLESPTKDDYRNAFLAPYRAEIGFNDASFGRLIGRLESTGRLDDTIVVVTADHGEEFFEHGKFQHAKSLYDEVLHVPLIVRFPGTDRIEPGSRDAIPARLADVLPTVLDLAGIDAPAGLEGQSLVAAGRQRPPSVYARLRIDGFDLDAVLDYPWKLVHDRKTGESAVYRLDADPLEAAPVDDPAELARLQSLLETHVAAERERAADAPHAPELPPEVQETLKALGYVE